MTTDLESLSDQELSEVFAREVAGWRLGDKKKVQYSGYWYDSEGTVTNLGVHNLKFATSADAVLPYLEKHCYVSECFSEETEWGKYNVQVKTLSGRTIGEGDHDSFARSACLALIKAKQPT